MSSNNASASALPPLIPLDEYLLNDFYKFFSSKSFAFESLTEKFDASLTLVNYKPMVTKGFVNSQGYMPFILELSSSRARKFFIEPTKSTDVRYGERGNEKAIQLDFGSGNGNIGKVIRGYGFSIYKKSIDANVIQGATSKDLVFDMIHLYPDVPFGKSKSEEETKSVEAQVKTLIQSLESNPTIRENFEIMYTIHTSAKQALYPHIFLIPKGIVNDISDFLLSQYQQNYGNVTLPPAEFVPNENVESPELQKFLEKLPIDLIAEAVVGTYGSSPAVFRICT